jgi:hypothetical protein
MALVINNKKMVFNRSVKSFNLALRLRMIRPTKNMADVPVIQVIRQNPTAKGGAITRQQPWMPVQCMVKAFRFRKRYLNCV